MAELTERELLEIDKANEAGSSPVMFVHGPCLLSISWDRWRAAFKKEQHGVQDSPIYKPDVDEEWITIEGGPTGSVPADVLRDEGEVYAAKLREAGVPVVQVRYGGTIHDFVMVNSLHDTDAALAAVNQAASVLKEALHKDG
jgi:hypothetical protein